MKLEKVVHFFKNPKPQIPNPKSQVLPVSPFGIWNLEFGIWNLIYNVPCVILISFLCLFFVSCQKANIKKVQILTNEKLGPSETGKNITFLYSDSAKVRAKLVTPLMETYSTQEPYIEMTKGVEVTFYDDSGKPRGYLKANYAIRYPNRRIMEAKDDVVVVNVKGDTMNTEHLIWDEMRGRIYSNKFVRVKTKKEIILSQGVESNETFSKYTFKNIKGTLQLKSGATE